MKFECSNQFSQQLIYSPCRHPDKSSPQPPVLFYSGSVINYHLIYVNVLQVASSVSVPTKTLQSLPFFPTLCTRFPISS